MARFEHPRARYQMTFNPAAAAGLRDQAGSDEYLHQAVVATVDSAMIKPIVWWVDADQRGLPHKDRTDRASEIVRLPDGSVRCHVEFNEPASRSIAQKASEQRVCPGVFVANAMNDLYQGDADARSHAKVNVVPLALVSAGYSTFNSFVIPRIYARKF